MPIDGVNNTPGNATAPTQRNQSEPTDRVGKEAFLELLVTQLQNQDPLQPQDGAEFVQQLAQFTHVEQSLRQSEALDVISLQLTGLSANEAVSLIGKDVVVKGDTISFDGINATGFAANLEKSSAETKVTIRNEAGEAVRTLDLGPKPAGDIDIPWDGRDDAGQVVQPGSYSVEISATDDTGTPIQVSQDVSGRVVGVDYAKGYPEIILESGARAPISDLVSVEEGSYGSGYASGLPQGATAGRTATSATTQAQLPFDSQTIDDLP